MGNRQRVAIWGTFDLLHQGHKTLLKEAAKLGDVYVIIIPDKVVEENKGYPPINDEHTRKRAILRIPYVKDCYIDSISQGLKSLLDIHPTIFCFGYDQKTIWERKVRELVANYDLTVRFVRLARYANGIHSRHLRKKLAA